MSLRHPVIGGLVAAILPPVFGFRFLGFGVEGLRFGIEGLGLAKGGCSILIAFVMSHES